jgi:hypothetical protein
VAEAQWRVPAGVRKGIPRGVGASIAATEIWPWLAVLGGVGLFVDWLLYGRSRAFRLRTAKMAAPLGARVAAWRKAS